MHLVTALFLLLAGGSLGAADSTADFEQRLQQVGQSRPWKKLLHYRAQTFGRERSLVDGQTFFLAASGKLDPVAELRESISAFQDPDSRVSVHKIHSRCAFPARFAFVKKHFPQSFKGDRECPLLDAFVDRFKRPETVSVVFSSAYPNNPASMFGHSFLKFNSKAGSDLTNMGVNYAARVPPEENSFAFIYFGIFGGYSGQWSLSPYHAKIKEYNQSENRDLWDYELALTPEEAHSLILHLWELEINGFFEYFFFDENCSFHVLAAIEAIKPQWDITGHTVYMIPGESIKNLFKQKGAVREVHFRSSQQGQFFQKFKALSRAEEKHFNQLIKGVQPGESVSILSVETAMEYFQYLDIKKAGALTPKERGIQKALLSQRASMGLSKIKLPPIVSETRPDWGHDSYSLHLSQTHRRGNDVYEEGGSTQVRIRSAYHDLLNNDLGYRRYSQIDFPSVELQYDQNLDQIRVNRVNLLGITSLNPINFLSYAPSWKFHSGLRTPKDYGCLSCRHVFVDVGIGLTYPLLGPKHVVYVMGTASGEIYDRLERGYRYGPGFDLGFISTPFRSMKLYLLYQQFFDLDQRQRSKDVQKYSIYSSFFLARNYELRLESELTIPTERRSLQNFENTLGIIYFFN